MSHILQFIGNTINPNNQADALLALEELLSYKETDELFYNCGLLSANLGDFDKSLYYYAKALDINPHYNQALFDLGALNSHLGYYEKALYYANLLIDIDPNYNNILMHLANLYSNVGKHNLSLDTFNKAISSNPHNLNLWADFFLCLNYVDMGIEDRIVLRNKFSELLPQNNYTKPIERSDKIKIGYVSSDFRNHAVSYFTKGLITKHSKEKFDVYFYSLSSIEDSITQEFKTNGNYKDCSRLNTQELYNLIVDDNIHILIDLNGFTQSNRIELFLHNPAPIQITWLGFLNSLGIPQIQYKITDVNLIHPENEYYYSEKLISLDNSLVYDPPSDFPDITELPYNKNGFVTFGFFNNLKKLKHSVFDTWIDIFKNHSNCKLIMLKSKYSEYNEFIESYFNSKGFHNIEFKEEGNLYQLMEYMNQVDIALDPFPHSGGATTGHCLWMGVPVITLEGTLEFERISSSILKNVGLNDFVSKNQDSYIQIGSIIDFKRLEYIRSNIRNNFPNPNEIIKNLESKLIMVYDSHCQ